MNGNGKPSEPSYHPISSCFAECEEIAFTLMAAAKDNKCKCMFEKLYESFKYSDKVSDNSSFEMNILSNLKSFSKALAEGQYDQLGNGALESNVNDFIKDVIIRNKRLLESKRGEY